jgi:hypothetical protein
MTVWTVEPLDLRETLRQERHHLLSLLDGLTDREWLAATPCPGWRVKDVVLHLLDDDLGWLSRGRDGELEGLIPMDVDYRDFVPALDQKNQRWVDASQGLSRRLVTELLAWTGEQVATYHDRLPMTEPAGVIWAGDRCLGGSDWAGTSPSGGSTNNRSARRWESPALTNGSYRRSCRSSRGPSPTNTSPKSSRARSSISISAATPDGI